jgi:SAM-dependent methyltransferase
MTNTEFLKAMRSFFSLIKPEIESVIELECQVSKWWVSSAHHRLFLVQWGLLPEPESFDHQINLHYHWEVSRNSMWVERGVFGSLCLKGKNVLELACGDGFNTKNFYSLRSSHVVACDYDPKAILTATKKNPADNIDYIVADLRTDMPKGTFENIVWDAAIEHFTPVEITHILGNIKERLTSDGILSGYTIVEREIRKSLSHHEYEFKSKEELMDLLIPYFRNVMVFETIYPDRHNLYFWGSDGVLPFSSGWKGLVTYTKEKRV